MTAASDDLWAVQAARTIATQLRKAHITTTVSTATSASDVARDIRAGRSDLGVFARPTDPFIVHAAAWFSVPAQGPASTLWTGYRDKTVDHLVETASKVMNPVNALPTYQQVGRRLWVMMPTLPLYTEPFVTAWSSDLSGVVDNPYDPGTLAAVGAWKIVSSDGGS